MSACEPARRPIGINYVDTYHRTGLYPVPLPIGLGVEAAGVVEEVGPDVSGFAVGERVGYNSGMPGAYAEQRLFPAMRLVKLPAGVSDEVAAGSMLKGMTVEYLIRRTFPVKHGQTVLVGPRAGVQSAHPVAKRVALLHARIARALHTVARRSR